MEQPKPMIPLLKQEDFETLFKQTPLTQSVLVYFTANWCGPCKRIDWNFIQEEFPDMTIYKCDIDDNKYTPGYCGVKSIPHFIMMSPTKQLENLQSNDTAKVATWIKSKGIFSKAE